jgi:hypothetical protein
VIFTIGHGFEQRQPLGEVGNNFLVGRQPRRLLACLTEIINRFLCNTCFLKVSGQLSGNSRKCFWCFLVQSLQRRAYALVQVRSLYLIHIVVQIVSSPNLLVMKQSEYG